MGIILFLVDLPTQATQVITLVNFNEFVEASIGLATMVGAAVFFKRAKKRKLQKLKEHQDRIDEQRKKKD